MNDGCKSVIKNIAIYYAMDSRMDTNTAYFMHNMNGVTIDNAYFGITVNGVASWTHTSLITRTPSGASLNNVIFNFLAFNNITHANIPAFPNASATIGSNVYVIGSKSNGEIYSGKQGAFMTTADFLAIVDEAALVQVLGEYWTLHDGAPVFKSAAKYL